VFKFCDENSKLSTLQKLLFVIMLLCIVYCTIQYRNIMYRLLMIPDSLVVPVSPVICLVFNIQYTKMLLITVIVFSSLNIAMLFFSNTEYVNQSDNIFYFIIR
jgi:hypothetical protein